MKLSKIKGFGTAKVKELEEKGITCVEELLAIPPPQYAEMTDVDNDTANKHFRLAKEAYMGDIPMFRKGSEFPDEEDIDRITTGSKALDKFFGGGVECRATTEIYAEFGAGKTQLCHALAVRVQLPVEKGGLNGKCVWINTENTFEKKRIKEIAEALEFQPDMILDGITVADAFNSVDQYDILLQVEKMLVADDSIRLIIIDSATGLFRQDFSGLGQLSERQKYMNRFLTLASNMAKIHNVCVVWTNQIYVAPLSFGSGITPVGGSIIAHKSTYRVLISKSGDYRIAKMVDSPKDAQTEVMFGLSKSGVVDMDVAKAEATALKKEKLAMKKEGKAGKTMLNTALGLEDKLIGEPKIETTFKPEQTIDDIIKSNT